MKWASQPSRLHVRRRCGFSLLELIIVIAILAILAALGAAAAMRLMAEQIQKNTEQSLQKIQTALNNQWRATVDYAAKEPLPPGVIAMANNNERLARVIYIKLRLRQEFPQTFAEARSASPIGPAKRSYVSYLQRAAVRPPIIAPDGRAQSNLFHECSACLYMALQQSRSGTSFDADTALSPKEISDTFNDGVKEIVDFWGNPVAFCRFPTGNTTLNPSPWPAAQHGWLDPQDPEGLISDAGGGFANLCHPPPPKGTSYKLVPVVYSSGRNMHYGVNPLTLAPSGNPQDEYDNVYSFDIRMLGHGN